MKTSLSRNQSGLSLVEALVGIALGLIVVAAMTVIVSNTSRTRSELAKTSQQIENGRFAIQLLSEDLHHAGFFGDLYAPPNLTPVSPLDPCLAANLTNINTLLYPVQGALAANLWTECKSAKDASGSVVNVSPAANTEVLVIRRADRAAVCSTAALIDGEYYLQADVVTAKIEQGDKTKFAFGSTTPAGSTSNVPCKFVDPVSTKLDPACGVHLTPNGAGAVCATRTAATIRKYHVLVYFVANFNGSPTLQRMDLGPTGFTVEPLVEGVENLRFEYGVDTDTSTSSFGIPDTYKAANAMSDADWRNVVAIRVYVLARNLQTSAGYSDDKTYTLGSYTSAPTDRTAEENKFKRHVFASTVSLYNPAGTRALP